MSMNRPQIELYITDDNTIKECRICDNDIPMGRRITLAQFVDTVIAHYNEFHPEVDATI